MTGMVQCAAPRTSCGSAAGWRAGGRCPRCRAAHNDETNRYRGITAAQRAEVLALLRAGTSPEEAAAAIGRPVQSLSGAAVRDGELRAALDGEPPERQRVARLGDYLAALTHAGGNKAAAIRRIGVPRTTVEQWLEDPRFAAVEKALLAWLASAAIRPRTRITHAALGQAAALLEQGSSITAAAKAVGTTDMTLRKHAARHERLRTALAERPPSPRGFPSGLAEVRERLAALWADEELTVSQIAAALRVGHSTVHRWAAQAGLPPRQVRRSSKRTPEKEAALREMWPDRAMPLQEIARRLGVSRTAVTGWAQEMGLPARGASRPAGRTGS